MFDIIFERLFEFMIHGKQSHDSVNQDEIVSRAVVQLDKAAQRMANFDKEKQGHWSFGEGEIALVNIEPNNIQKSSP